MLVFLAVAGESAGAMRASLFAGPRARGRRSASGVPIFRVRPRSTGSAPAARRSWRRSTTWSRRSGSRTRGRALDLNTPARWARMQFLPCTWARTRSPHGARRSGAAERIRPGADAIYCAANLLKAYGAPGDWPGAIFAYNHSSAYVQAGPLASSRLLHARAHRAGVRRHDNVDLRPSGARRPPGARSAFRRRAAIRPGRSRSRPGSRRSSPRPSSPTAPARGAMTCRSAATATRSCPPGSPGRR